MATDRINEAAELLSRAGEELLAAELDAAAGGDLPHANSIAALRGAVESDVVLAVRLVRVSRDRHVRGDVPDR